MKRVKEDNGALSTVKNGPRLRTIDYLGVKTGKELSYQFIRAHRDTSMGIRNGTRA